MDWYRLAVTILSLRCRSTTLRLIVAVDARSSNNLALHYSTLPLVTHGIYHRWHTHRRAVL